MPTLSNPFTSFKVGQMSTLGNVLIVIAIAVVILTMFGLLIYIFFVKKQYYINIHLFRRVGNTPTRIGVFSAKIVPFGMAGDTLWRVAPAGFWKFKIVKWLPVGKIQSAPNEYWYWWREDGEWINYAQEDLDLKSKIMKVKFVHEDMRLQRLATDRLLEQRLMNKGFWEKYGNMIMTMIFFLIIAICMVIIFYQWSKLLDKMAPLVTNLDKSLQVIEYQCRLNFSSQGIVPAGNVVGGITV